MREERVIIAGFGGQGVIFTSMVLAWAGLYDEKRVVQMPSYGPEIRGGTANGTAVISDTEIHSPIIKHPSAVIVMNEPSLKKFVDDFPNDLSIENSGLVVISTSMVKRKPKRKNIEIVEIKATEIAEKVGNPKVANMVALGAYLETRKILSWDSIFKGLEVYLAKLKKDKFFDLNKKALEAGAEAVKI